MVARHAPSAAANAPNAQDTAFAAMSREHAFATATTGYVRSQRLKSFQVSATTQNVAMIACQMSVVLNVSGLCYSSANAKQTSIAANAYCLPFALPLSGKL